MPVKEPVVLSTQTIGNQPSTFAPSEYFPQQTTLPTTSSPSVLQTQPFNKPYMNAPQQIYQPTTISQPLTSQVIHQPQVSYPQQPQQFQQQPIYQSQTFQPQQQPIYQSQTFQQPQQQFQQPQPQFTYRNYQEQEMMPMQVVHQTQYIEKQVPVPYEVEKIVDRFVEVPVTREVEVPVDRVVEKNIYIEVPVEKIVTREVQVPVDRIVDREVEVERIVYRDVPVTVEVEKIREVEVPVHIDRVVYKEVPVDRIVEKIVEKRVEVPVDRVIERIIEREVKAQEAPPPQQQQPQFAGLGVVLDRYYSPNATDKGMFWQQIKALIPGGSAQHSNKLTSGDILLAINGHPVFNCEPSQVKQLTTGPIGSPVNLQIMRNGQRYNTSITRTSDGNPAALQALAGARMPGYPVQTSQDVYASQPRQQQQPQARALPNPYASAPGAYAPPQQQSPNHYPQQYSPQQQQQQQYAPWNTART